MARLSEQELDLIQQARSGGESFARAKAKAAQLARREQPSQGRTAGLSALVDFVATNIVGPIKLAMARRKTIAQLRGLDDRLLADIGLERGMLDQAADGVAAREAGIQTKPVGVVANIRAWLTRRATIRELQALDDRMLADIGIARGDIEATVVREAEAKAVLAAVPTTVEDLIAQARVRTSLERRPEGANSNSRRDHQLAVGQSTPAYWQA